MVHFLLVWFIYRNSAKGAIQSALRFIL